MVFMGFFLYKGMKDDDEYANFFLFYFFNFRVFFSFFF